MDRKTAVIRAEMSQTRAALDHKLTQLEDRARQLSPKRYAVKYMPDYPLDRAIGGVLTLVGLGMAFKAYRERRRRARMRHALATYAYW